MKYISLEVKKNIELFFVLFYKLNMNKKEKLRKSGHTYKELSVFVGVTERAVFNWFNDKSPITVQNAYKIEALTNGAVSVEDFK